MSDYKEIDSLPMRFMSLLYSNKGENVTKNATTAVLISTRSMLVCYYTVAVHTTRSKRASSRRLKSARARTNREAA